jgi:hypothetical protein
MRAGDPLPLPLSITCHSANRSFPLALKRRTVERLKLRQHPNAQSPGPETNQRNLEGETEMAKDR